MQFLFLLLHPAFRGYRANKASTASNRGSRQPCSATEGLQEKRLPPLQDKQHPPTATTALGWHCSAPLWRGQRRKLGATDVRTGNNNRHEYYGARFFLLSTFQVGQKWAVLLIDGNVTGMWSRTAEMARSLRYKRGTDSPCTNIQTSILLHSSSMD